MLLVMLWLLGGGAASAADYQGLSLSTPFPAQVIQANESVTLTLTVRSYGLPPQVVHLELREVPEGWQASFLGGGRVVKAVYVEPDGSATVSLKLEPPSGVRPATYRFLVVAKGEEDQAELPLELTVGEAPPPQLGLEVELPVLKGSPNTTFRYRATLKNESDKELLVSLEADAPEGFDVRFKLAYGGEEVSSLPLKGGESKRLDIEVRPPQGAPAGDYPLKIRAQGGEASAELKLTAQVTGQPELTLTTPDGKVSARIYGGRTTPLKLWVLNKGSAPVRDVRLSAYEPRGWEVKFDPERIDEIAPGERVDVIAKIKPAAKALAGDYMVTINARGEGSSDSTEFRITLLTSTLWGMVGILLIAAALGVVVFAVARFGRR